ncbi:Hypothetical protein, putative [Bodo saltans]|uniref:VHS domain-containing protein n=1 Tax=Bodo saltans TaxID=75058 RepID=A0A0S4JSH6_BODSA|nr:Hypothetical protein, putative [Bodo saltans]|eukprot:CUG92039.1 Hypothetical protein, putative [Bodo saltans]
MDEVKDKAARIIPSAYSEILEETTSDVLLAPNFQNIVFLCDSANANPENVVDIVRAVRRRIDNKSAKVQFFTIQVLDSLIKNCGPTLHHEVADTKGLLHDVFVAATKKPSRDGEREATQAALTLILNMSIWFSGHADERLRALTELADHVRKSSGPNIFEGIEPDVTVQLKRSNASSAASTQAARQQAAARRQRRQETEYLRLQQEYALSAAQQQPHRQPTVKAIPLIIPTDEEVSGMLDACLVLAECLNTAESQGTPIVGDELISNVATQIRRDHRNLAMILSSGAEIPNMDVLFSVTDSQTAIIQRLSSSVKAERGHAGGESTEGQANDDFQNATGGASMAPPHPGSQSNHHTTTSHSNVGNSPPRPGQGQPSHMDHRGHTGIRQAADVEDYEDVEMQVTPKLPPTMDDLFGGPTSAPLPAAAAATSSSASAQPPQEPARVSSAFPQPTQSLDHQVATPVALSHQDETSAAVAMRPQPGTSLNNEEDGDEFDNFLNSRLRK